MLSADQLKTYISENLHCDHLVVNGDDGRHYEALVVSPLFEGLSRVKRHQLVYAALGDRMRAEIHALSLKTLTPAEWRSA